MKNNRLNASLEILLERQIHFKCLNIKLDWEKNWGFTQNIIEESANRIEKVLEEDWDILSQNENKFHISKVRKEFHHQLKHANKLPLENWPKMIPTTSNSQYGRLINRQYEPGGAIVLRSSIFSSQKPFYQ